MKKSTGSIFHRIGNAFAYSDMTQAWNIAVNLYERTTQKTRLLSRPFVVQVDVTNRCNLNCVFCLRHNHSLELGDLSPDLIPKIIKLSRRARELILFGYGEPLIAESFHALMRESRSGRVSFTTNGILLTQGMVRRIAEESGRPIHHITFSIDAIKPEIYKSIREGSNFDKVWNNLKALLEFKASNKRCTPEIWINFVAMRRNIEELPHVIEEAANVGISQIIVFHLVVWDKTYRNESLIHYPELTERVFSEAKRIAGKLDVRLDLPIKISINHGNNGLQKQNWQLPRCYQPWSYVYIRYDGSVQGCCFSDNLIMGNLKEKSFDEIWNGSSYQHLRRTVNRNPIKDCRRCELRYRYTPSPNDMETYNKLQPRKK